MSTRSDCAVHHCDAAALTHLEVFIGGGGTAAAGPAELILAVTAHHVIAPLVLFDSGAARRAEAHIFLVLFTPALKLFLHGFFAADVGTVPLIFALEAHDRPTGGTGHLQGVALFSAHVRVATRLGAPSHQGV